MPCKHLMAIAHSLAEKKNIHQFPFEHPDPEYGKVTYPDGWWCDRCQSRCQMAVVIKKIRAGLSDDDIEFGFVRMVIAAKEAEQKRLS